MIPGGADGLIVVHPNWWSQPPAILKGWMDRVLRQGVAYEFGEGGAVIGLLEGKTALVLTTSNTPREPEYTWRTTLSSIILMTSAKESPWPELTTASSP